MIGTGSSGVQAIPILANEADHVTVFQRTATYAAPARKGPPDPETEAEVKADYPGFRAAPSPASGCASIPATTRPSTEMTSRW